MAPGQRCAQGALAWWGLARAAAEKAQALAEPVVQALQAQVRHARGGQFDGQRHAVELTADGHHGGDVAFVEHEALVGGPGAVFKQPHGAGRAGFGQGLAGRQRQRADPVDLLGRQAQRLLAGGQHLQARRLREQRGGQLGHRVDEVFAVVQHQQHLHRLQGLRQRLPRGDRCAGADGVLQRLLQHTGHVGQQRLGLRQRRQVDEHRAVREAPLQLAGHGTRQRRLADAASADDGDQPMRRQQVGQRLKIVFAPEQQLGRSLRQRGRAGQRGGRNGCGN